MLGINTITDFLQKKGVKSDGSPNALVDAETYALLEKEFGAGRAVNSERVNIRERIAQKQATVTLDDDAKGKGGKNDEELLVKSNVISVKDEVASMGPETWARSTSRAKARRRLRLQRRPRLRALRRNLLRRRHPLLRRFPLRPNRSCRRPSRFPSRSPQRRP